MNLMMSVTTGGWIATASANAIERIIAVWIFPDASGFLPIASSPFPAKSPIASAGPIEPMPMTRAVARSFTDSVSRSTPAATFTASPSILLVNSKLQIPNYKTCLLLGACDLVLIVLMMPHRDTCEYHCKHREYERLNKTDKKFEHKERHRDEVRHEKSRDDQEYLARKHVSKQPERERYYFSNFRNKFKDADKKIDRIPERKKFRKMLYCADRGDSEYVYGKYRNDSERKREVYVACRGAEKRNEFLSLARRFIKSD